MSTKPDFSKEDLHGTPAELAPGCWVCGDAHAAGSNDNMRVNNRAFVFRLTLKADMGSKKAGSDVLFVLGVGKQPIVDGVKKLEQETGLKAVALLCNGGSHHVFAKLWYEAFSDMQIWICPTKVPTTANGERLRQDYPDRWELADNTTVPHHVYQLLYYFGSGDDLQVDCVLFNQLYTYADKASEECGCWTGPEDKPVTRTQLGFFSGAMGHLNDYSTRTDDIAFYHKASGLLVTGHQWQFVYVSKDYQMPEELQWRGGFVFSVLLYQFAVAPGSYGSTLNALFQRLDDPKIHAEQWQEVLQWDFRYATSHHDPVGLCGPIGDKAIMEGEGGLKGHFKRTLEETGELTGEPDAGSWFPWKSANLVYKVLQSEPGFVKQYGEPPELCYGGPGYDEVGKKKA